MSNFKWGFLAGAVALVLSFMIGLISGVNILHVMLRALIFGVLFFGLGFGIRMFIDSFFPEILSAINDDEENDTLASPGSRVNITLDSVKGFAMPEMYRNPEKPDEVGNIGDLVTGAPEHVSKKAGAAMETSSFGPGIDQKQEDDYTYGVFDIPGIQDPISETDSQAVGNNSRVAPVFTPSFGDGDAGLGGLPDLDALAGAFLNNDAGARPPPAEPGGPVRSPLSNKPEALKGDFNPKELAEGLRTILIKDKE